MPVTRIPGKNFQFEVDDGSDPAPSRRLGSRCLRAVVPEVGFPFGARAPQGVVVRTPGGTGQAVGPVERMGGVAGLRGDA